MTQLRFVQEPSRVYVDSLILPTVQVTLLGNDGLPVSGDQVVTLELVSATGAALSGVTSVAATSGVATFSSLRVTQAGTFQLRAALGTLATTSQLFDVVALPVVADSTVITLVSTPGQLAAGSYVFTVVGTPPALVPGTILTGGQGGGFLRKVRTSQLQGNLLTVTTDPASMTDAVRDGVLQVGTQLTLADAAPAPVGPDGVVWGAAEVVAALPGVTIEGSMIKLQDVVLVGQLEPERRGLIIEEGQIQFEPTFNVSVDIGLWTLKEFEATLSGQLQFSANVWMGAEGSFTPSIPDVSLLKLSKPFVAQIGPLFVFGRAILEFVLVSSVSAAGEASLAVGAGGAAGMKVGLRYQNKTWSPITEPTATFAAQPPEIVGQASATARVGVKARAQVMLYEAVGPYLTVEPYLAGEFMVDLVKKEWSTSCRSGIGVVVGIEAKILSFNLGDWPSPPWTLGERTHPICTRSGAWYSDATLAIVSGNQQSGQAGAALDAPLVVDVRGPSGQPVAGVPVRFSVTAGGGSVAPIEVLTSAAGTAQASWVLGSAGPTQRAEARVLGALGSPVVFQAQLGTGTIVGEVRHALTNVPLGGATVRRFTGSVLVQTVQTTQSGAYAFSSVPAGLHRLEASAPGFKENTAENVKIVTLAAGDVARVDFALPPVTSTQRFGALAGRVFDASGSPLAGVDVTLSGGVQTNGVFRATKTANNGTYGFAGVVLDDVSGAPIAQFTAAASAPNYSTESTTLTLLENQVVANIDFTLSASTVTLYFFDGFETPSSWMSTGFWNRSTLNGIKNAAVPVYVKLAPDDPSGGFLPLPASGTFAFWYGQPSTGNFMGAQRSTDAPGSGGTSVSANSGTLTSPTLFIPQNAPVASLWFDTWFEVESVNPNSNGFDLMEVFVIDAGTGMATLLGLLNPFVDPTLSNRNAIPFTSAGFNRAPIWRPVSFDLNAFRGKSIRLRFTFRTVDHLYNGFRGWLVDNVEVSSRPPLSGAAGSPSFGAPGMRGGHPRRGTPE